MKKTVLVVENRTLSRTVIVAILEFNGLRCIAAENGQQALELLTISHCDLILTNLTMPIVDGIEFIKIVRKREKLMGVNKPIPIVVLSSDRNDIVKSAKAYGISGCFVKSTSSVSFDKPVPTLKRLLGEIVWDRQLRPH